jgi:hypothetical protein
MTAKQWVKDNYIKHGKLWIKENFQRFCHETNPKNENYESYCSTLRIVERELKLEDPDTYTVWEPSYKSDVSTVDNALDFHGVDLSRMKITGARVNTWGNENNPNKQVRLELKPKDGLSTEQLKQDFIDAVRDYQAPKLPNIKAIGDCMLEVDIYDFHFGLLSLGKETMHGDYDIKIAKAMFFDMISKIIEWSKSYQIEQILFPIGNDFYNSDNHLNTTTKGTVQTDDTRWQKTFTEGWKLIRDAITILRNIAPVNVTVIPANHDHERSYYLGSVMEAWFKDDGSVTIDNGPEYYKRFKYGKNLIGLTHGDKGNKPGQLPLLMATRWPQDWADTKYREWRTGHVHNESVKEYPGCKVFSLGASSQPSEWGASSGYDSMIESKGVIWHSEKGKIATLHCRPEEI